MDELTEKTVAEEAQCLANEYNDPYDAASHHQWIIYTYYIDQLVAMADDEQVQEWIDEGLIDMEGQWWKIKRSIAYMYLVRQVQKYM